jgi:uncharacterized membrane protein
MLYYWHMQPSQQQPQPEQQGFYRPSEQAPFQAPMDDQAPPTVPAFDEATVVAWEASEYIHRSKDAVWASGFIFVVLALLAMAIFFQAWTFAILVVVMGAAMGVFAFRPPQTKQYTLSHQGLKINDKMYYLRDYRAFGILSEDAFYSVVLLPTGRFKPAVSVYFAEDDGEKIVDILGSHLPMEELTPDPIDIIMRRLHF